MPRGRTRTIELPMDEIRELTEQGWRMGALAERYGCSKDTIWNRMKEHGIPRHSAHSLPGEHNPAWKGGRQTDGDGYILIWSPDHPHATKQGYVREHRLAMEETLGRYLTPEEVVHHIDGDKANNDPSNLEVFERNSQHLRDTLKGKIPNWTPQGKARIGKSAHLRKPISEETRKKMRQSQSNRPRRPHSPETREKLRLAAQRRGGHPHSEQSKEKIRQAALQRAERKRIAIHQALENDGDQLP